MSRFVVINNITLDGVMQAPGRPDEDTRDGFEHGGWAVMPNEDPNIGSGMAERMAEGGPLLLGRRTYEDLFGFWSNQTNNPFTEVLNQHAEVRCGNDAGDLCPGSTPRSSRATWLTRWPGSSTDAGTTSACSAAAR